MMELTKEISQAKFDRFNRIVFCVHVTSDKNIVQSRKFYLSKESAYKHMEEVLKWVNSDNGLDWKTDDDLDCRPSTIVTKAGFVYELLTLPLEY